MEMNSSGWLISLLIVLLHVCLHECIVFKNKKCYTEELQNSTFSVNCSNQGRTRIPTNLPNRTTHLDFSYNLLDSIVSAIYLTELKFLNLSHNPICSISLDAFSKLSHLLSLSILSKAYCYSDELFLSSMIFRNLSQVKSFELTLDVKHAKQKPTYLNSSALLDMKTLESLLISCYFLPFEPRMKSLTRLMYLTIVGPCFNFIVPKFEYLPYLLSLKVEQLQSVEKINDDIFASLMSLRTLQIEGKISNICPRLFDTMIQAINRTNVSTLHLDSILPLTYFEEPFDISGILTLISKNISNLSLCFNFLTKGDLLRLPNSITNLQIRSNCLKFDDVLRVAASSPNETNIKVIDARDQFQCPKKTYPAATTFKNKLTSTDTSKSYHYVRNKHHQIALQRLQFSKSSVLLPEHFSGLFVNQVYEKVKFLSRNDDRVPDIDGSFFIRFPNLYFLNLARCCIQRIENVMFSQSLKSINLADNALGGSLMRVETSNWFSKSLDLEAVDLSYNEILNLPTDLVANNFKLKMINLSHNHITDFTLLIPPSIVSIDVSFNLIQSLESSVMDALDQAARTKDVALNYSGNPMACNCANLDFLNWLIDSKVHVYHREMGECKLPNGTKLVIKDLPNWLPALRSECQSYRWIIGSCAGLTVLITIVIGSVLYRKRWQIRYLYYAVKMALPRASSKTKYERLYEYDAFVSYAEEDGQFIKNGLIANLEEDLGVRLCIHERDFLPGESIAFNISRAIHSSKRTILVLSKDFFESSWCMFELNMSRIEAVYTERRVILVIMLKELSPRTLPLDVVDLIRSNTYIEYPDNDADRELFWKKCLQFIQSSE